MRYPFEPRSTASLEPGQFWGIPLAAGGFACGRVLAVPREPDPFVPVSTRMFLAGLLDWVGDDLPTDPSIAGSAILRQGFAHVMTIRENGRWLLGNRPLEADGLVPHLWRTHALGADVWVYEGARRVRPAQPSDAALPVMETWGYSVVARLADGLLGRR